jgi:hypothetical protein
MPSILQKQTTRETDPLTLRGEVANTAIPIILGTTASPIAAGSTTQLTTGQASVGHYIIKAGAASAGANATALYTISCSGVGETFLDGAIDADSYAVDVSITSMDSTAQSTAQSVGTIEAAITGNNTIVIRRAASQVSATLLAGNINLRLTKREFDLEELVA